MKKYDDFFDEIVKLNLSMKHRGVDDSTVKEYKAKDKKLYFDLLKNP